jgi:hypothetical protein
MKISHLALLLWLCMAAGLGAQTSIPQPAKHPFFLWAGAQIGAYGGTMAVLACGLSVQFSRNGYGSVYWLGGSEPFGNDSVNEYGIMAGPCYRTRSLFTGAAAGLGVTSDEYKRQGVGVPLKLEASLIAGRFVAFSLQLHAFICKRSAAGVSLGLQLGKLR